MPTELTRRTFLAALVLGVNVLVVPARAVASDDDSGGGGSGGSGSGSGSGNGSSNSQGEDDDDDKDEDNGSSEANKARDAVAQGKAVTLSALVAFLKKTYPGKVLDVDLKRSSGRYEYRVKILQASGKVVRLRLDALTLQTR